MRAHLFLIVISLATAPAFAQPPAARLTVADAVAEALAKHPDVAAAERRHEAALQRPVQERSLPDPMVAAGYTSAGNPLPGAGLGKEPTAGIGVMVSQEFPYPGKRDARAAVAAREADAEFQEIEAARLSVAARVRQAYYALAYARVAAGVLERNRDLLATLLKVSEERYAVGQAAQQDVIKAQTQLSLLALQQTRIRHVALAREGELNALLRRTPGTPVGELDELVLPPFTEALESLAAAAIEHAPMLKRDRLMIDRSKLAVDLARRDYQPDFALSGGYTFMGAMPAMYEVRFGMTLPLQRKRRAAAVSEQLSLAAAAEQTYEGARLALQARLQEDFEMAATAARLATLYRDTVLPQARLAFESSMASYQTGAVDFLSVLTNFSMVLEYEMTYFEEVAQLHQAISRLEEMTGTRIAH
ncbi:MAG TPA: TolC family protein [Vicinamibacterales bacterium]|nr:TolC family protein [Vicinamibacterales bacterium]